VELLVDVVLTPDADEGQARGAEDAQRRDERIREDERDAHRPVHEPGHAMGVLQGQALRHQLADHDVDECQCGDGGDGRHAVHADHVDDVRHVDVRLEPPRQFVLGEHAQSQAGDRDA
jgi:hypothetical protein